MYIGAFTTFSTFSVDIIKYLDQNLYRKAFIYAASTNILSVSAALIAYKIVKKGGIFKKL
jgi:fluoride ion exporter CrcB/FEX